LTLQKSVTTWDEAKRGENLRRHGMDLAHAEYFEFDTALVEEDRDVRHEARFRATGWLRGRLCFLVFTLQDGDEVHAISLRPATPKERRHYYVEET
jgi:uncharacterized protein